MRRLLSLICTVMVVVPVANAEEGFDAILESQTRETFDRITDYLAANPTADDADRAYRWLFATALNSGLESDAVSLAENYLKRQVQTAATTAAAEQVRMLGLARGGKAEKAVQMYLAQLKFARFQSAGPLIESGMDLATALRMAREFEGARAIYEAVGAKFFLNSSVQERCRNKAQKLDLLDHQAPMLNGTDTQGQKLELNALRGRVVLVDFWATNCPPCLEEFPNIKAIYREFHDQGFEIIGVSLDGDTSLVESFTERMKMPWPQIVDAATVKSLRETWQVRTIPSLYIIGRDGKVNQCDVRGRDLRTTVKALIRAE